MNQIKTDHNKLVEQVHVKVNEIANYMEKTQIADYVQLLNNPKRLIWLNLLSGISRGVGIAIGVTLFTSTIVYILQVLGALNIPIIGDYIAEIVRHVKYQVDGVRY